MCASKENQHCIGASITWRCCQQGSLALGQLPLLLIFQSTYIFESYLLRIAYIWYQKHKNLISGRSFVFIWNFVWRGNVYKVCCSKVSKYPPLAKLCHVWIQNLFLTQIKKKWLNMENKLALSILGDLDQIDWFVE